jgi:hypothetical protein
MAEVAFGSHHHPIRSIPPSNLPLTRRRDIDRLSTLRLETFSQRRVLDKQLREICDRTSPGRLATLEVTVINEGLSSRKIGVFGALGSAEVGYENKSINKKTLASKNEIYDSAVCYLDHMSE